MLTGVNFYYVPGLLVRHTFPEDEVAFTGYVKVLFLSPRTLCACGCGVPKFTVPFLDHKLKFCSKPTLL